MKAMRILVACESSGTVRDSIDRLDIGHEVVSCDLLPSETPGNHIQGDVTEVLQEPWDLIIAHPPCTYLTNSAEWAYKDPDFDRYPRKGYHQKPKKGTLVGAERRSARAEAVRFFLDILESPCPRVAIENPVGYMTRALRPADQYIHPYQFGDDASKKTGLWLKNLPLLTPTKEIPPRMVDGRPRWGNQTDSGQNKLPPSKDRWKVRSKTYQGIADAIVDQWILKEL